MGAFPERRPSVRLGDPTRQDLNVVSPAAEERQRQAVKAVKNTALRRHLGRPRLADLHPPGGDSGGATATNAPARR